ncbi:uncharacterized protein BJX67DRAFT_314796 [Aspergillus lucknowensis]|uniref:Uncharacterized protein n=1 Tax=Aspergillus lucknowensis TaxID=176173 RepID=A0ABR4L9T6_9EURO
MKVLQSEECHRTQPLTHEHEGRSERDSILEDPPLAPRDWGLNRGHSMPCMGALFSSVLWGLEGRLPSSLKMQGESSKFGEDPSLSFFCRHAPVCKALGPLQVGHLQGQVWYCGVFQGCQPLREISLRSLSILFCLEKARAMVSMEASNPNLILLTESNRNNSRKQWKYSLLRSCQQASRSGPISSHVQFFIRSPTMDGHGSCPGRCFITILLADAMRSHEETSTDAGFTGPVLPR